MQYLEETFWRQQFFDSRAIRDALANSLLQARVLPLQELAELAVRQVLEQDVNFHGHQIYSPEREYQGGETLNFLTPTGVRRGLVLYAEPGHATSIGGVDLSFDGIWVRFKDSREPRLYVSACSNFPTRFSYDHADSGETNHQRTFTPGQLVKKFGETILPVIKEVLSGDPRFCAFDGEEWMLSQFLADLNELTIRKILAKLRESGGASPEDLGVFICGSLKDSAHRASTAFSISYQLKNDTRHRFTMSRTDSGVVWMLAPPPKQVVCTLDEEMISAGRIRVSGEFEKIVDFYGLTSVLNVQAYGGYSLKAMYDPALRLIYGDDVRLWVEENGLSPGHKLYIKSPSSLNAPLILFSEHEVYKSPESGEPVAPPHPRLFLRHKIYGVLIDGQQWLHYREITEHLNNSGCEVQSDSIIATLSSNEHLFCRREPARGLWGLTKWLNQPTHYPVNLQSLSITIREEEWVHRVLREEGAPLLPKEIIRRLSEIFGVSLGTIQELTIIDGSDPAFDQLRDGRLLLHSWISEWEERLRECEQFLIRCRDLRNQASTMKGNVFACQRKLQQIDELLASQLAAETNLLRRISELRDEIRKARPEHTSFSERLRVLESELTSIEKRCQKLTRWRTLALASYSLVGIYLLFGAPVAIQVFSVLGSTVACLSIYRLIGTARRKVHLHREQLHCVTGRSVAASTRLENAQQELVLKEKEHAAVRDTSHRLTIEQESLRPKMKEFSDALLTMETELGHIQESKIAEERALLVELLRSCSEVSRGR
jgi:translation initiation factor 2B subunit (eIF-2B alpha/beta/delta family)